MCLVGQAGRGALWQALVRMIAAVALFGARRTRLRHRLIQHGGQFGQQRDLLAGVQRQAAGLGVDQLQLPGQQGQAGIQRRQGLAVQV